MSGDKVAFGYTSPGIDANTKPDETPASENVYNALPAVQAIVSLFSQEFVVTNALTKFDVTRVKLTSVSDPDLWFTVTL
jgi:hypothetical protein